MADTDEIVRRIKKIYTLLKSMDQRLIAVEAELNVVKRNQTATLPCSICGKHNCYGGFNCRGGYVSD